MLAVGQKDKALACIQQALLIESRNPAFLAQKVYCLLALHRNSEANNLTQDLATLCDHSAALQDTLGNLYSLNKKQQLAQEAFTKAVALEPNNPHFSFNLALAHQSMGDLAEAEQAFNRSITLRPDDYEAWLHRSRLRKQNPDKNHIPELESLVASGISSPKGDVAVRYALAKEYEDIGKHSESFGHLCTGARIRRSHIEYSIKSDKNAMDTIIQQFSADFLQRTTKGYHSDEPIFIVGLPRTGTTLVERIISSHSSVYAAGELDNFSNQLSQQVSTLKLQKPTDRSQFISATTQVDYNALGKAYVESTRPQTGHTHRFIDKLPLNFLYCGLILRALPQAKIIHLTRHPMDVCYAIFKTLFQKAYPYSYDLQELGQYYLSYRKLMTHWHKLMPERIFDVSYEQLIQDQEGISRKMLDYCDLIWEADCLDFHNNTAPSTTASLAQIRRPLYSTSVGLWRNHQKQLQPLQDMFENAGMSL